MRINVPSTTGHCKLLILIPLIIAMVITFGCDNYFQSIAIQNDTDFPVLVQYQRDGKGAYQRQVEPGNRTDFIDSGPPGRSSEQETTGFTIRVSEVTGREVGCRAINWKSYGEMRAKPLFLVTEQIGRKCPSTD